jgi:hypothetical protein
VPGGATRIWTSPAFGIHSWTKLGVSPPGRIRQRRSAGDPGFTSTCAWPRLAKLLPAAITTSSSLFARFSASIALERIDVPSCGPIVEP